MTTGQRIKAARKKANMTQAELATLLEIPFQSVSQWERDIRRPKKETLEKIAEKLGVFYLDLYGDEDSKEVAAYMKEGMRLGLNTQTGLQRTEVLAEYRSHGYEFTTEEARLVSAYNNLNDNGRFQVLLLTEGMAKIPRFMLHPQDMTEGPDDK